MIRFIRFAFWGLVALCLVVVALANRGPVPLRLLPEGMGGFLGFSWSVTLPLFLVILGGVAAGLLIGFVWEWLREHKHRAEAARQRREARKLEREVTRLKTPATGRSDDVLALLEDGSTPR